MRGKATAKVQELKADANKTGAAGSTEHGDPSTAATTDIIRLKLTAEQASQLAPLATRAAASRQNVLFVALCAPFWNGDGTFWDLQTTLIPARIGHKIIKLVRSQKGGPR